MADEVQWHSRRVAAFVLFLLYVNRRRRNRMRWNNRKIWTKRYISRNLTLGACVFIRCRRNVPQIWTILNFLDELKVTRSSSRPSAILWSVTQITCTERVLWLVDSHQHKFANRSHVKYEFTNTKKLVKKLARIEASSICRQQFANVFADSFCAVHTHQLEFANTSLPTLVCRVKAA